MTASVVNFQLGCFNAGCGAVIDWEGSKRSSNKAFSPFVANNVMAATCIALGVGHTVYKDICGLLSCHHIAEPCFNTLQTSFLESATSEQLYGNHLDLVAKFITKAKDTSVRHQACT